MDFIRHHVKERESKIPTSFKSCNSSIQLPSSKFLLSSANPVDRRQSEENINGTQVFTPSPVLDDDQVRHYHQKNPTLPQQQKQNRERDDLEEPKPESDPYPDPLPISRANVTGPQIITKPKYTCFSGVRHRECLKNHAASTGGQVFDGCGEFMPSGEEGTLGALKCAACQCHRNFHRKEVEEEEPHHDSVTNSYIKINRRSTSLAPKLSLLELSPLPLQYQKLSPGLVPIGRPSPLPLPHAMMGFNGGGTDQSYSDQDNNLGYSNSAEASGAKPPASFHPSKKRFRTKFTREQKDKMLEFAEKIGWRIQKHDEPAVQMLCSDLGIKREVLKVWMHNNKNSPSMKNQLFDAKGDEP